jgi:hypothetical protein
MRIAYQARPAAREANMTDLPGLTNADVPDAELDKALTQITFDRKGGLNLVVPDVVGLLSPKEADPNVGQDL